MWGSPGVVHRFHMNLAVGRLDDTGNEASGEENHEPVTFGKRYIDYTVTLRTKRSTFKYLTLVRKCVSQGVRVRNCELNYV